MNTPQEIPTVSHNQPADRRRLSTDKSGLSSAIINSAPRRTKVFDQFKENRKVQQQSFKVFVRSTSNECSKECQNSRENVKSFGQKLKKMVPAIEWMPKYNLNKLSADVLAGLTVGVMLIPQSMAYALLAGLSPIYGMYSASFVLAVFAFFTTSKQLSIGPVATTSILISDAVAGYGFEDETDGYTQLTVTLCFASGVIQLLMGLFRLGFVVKFLSRPVMSGFTTGAACIIAINQFKDLFGLSFERTPLFRDTLANVLTHLSETELKTLGLSVFSLVVLMSVKFKPLKKYCPKWFPVPLLLIVVGITMSYFLDFESKGIRVVGPVPSGLGKFEAPDLSKFTDLFADAIILSVTSYMGSIALAETFATKERESVDPNQELIAFGIACLFGSFNQSQTVSGSFSRSALNYDMGAKTPAAGIFTSLLMILSLLLFTKVFEYLPTCILAAMILVSVRGLLDYPEVEYLFKTKRSDLIQFWVCVLSTLFIGIKEGIIIGMAISLVMQIHRSVTPKIPTLGLLENTHSYVDIERFPEAKTFPGIKIIGFSTELFFGNGRNLKEMLTDLVRNHSDEFEAVIIDGHQITTIDSTAQRDLAEVLEECRSCEMAIVFAAIPGETRDVMDRADMRKLIGYGTFFISVHDAVQFTVANLELHTRDDKKRQRYRASIAHLKDQSNQIAAEESRFPIDRQLSGFGHDLRAQSPTYSEPESPTYSRPESPTQLRSESLTFTKNGIQLEPSNKSLAGGGDGGEVVVDVSEVTSPVTEEEERDGGEDEESDDGDSIGSASGSV